MTKQILAALTLTSVLSGCASMPEPIQPIGNAAKAGVSAVRDTATRPSETATDSVQVPVAKTEVLKAGVLWDNKFADKFSGQNAFVRAAGNIAWQSPHGEFIRIIVKDNNARSNATELMASGQISATLCNRTPLGAGTQALSGVTRTITGVGNSSLGNSGIGQIIRKAAGATETRPAITTTAPRTTTMPNGAFSGLTPDQISLCKTSITEVNIEVDKKVKELLDIFSRMSNGSKPTIEITGTNNAHFILGLTRSPTR